MSEALLECNICRSLVDTEDLFCANCGTESPHPDSGKLESMVIEAVNFGCKSCGASMNYDASASSLRCPFCASTDLQEQSHRQVVKPDIVVPFRIHRSALEQGFRSWCGRGFFRCTSMAGRPTRSGSCRSPVSPLSTGG